MNRDDIRKSIADFVKAKLTTDEEIKKILKDHDRWVYNRTGVPADLSGLDLSGLDLSGKNLVWAKLDRADLSGADLRDADLQNAQFISACFANANLAGANLTDANFQFSNFSGAIVPPSIRYCWNIQHATFPADALPWLVLHPKWNRDKDTVKIVETN